MQGLVEQRKEPENTSQTCISRTHEKPTPASRLRIRPDCAVCEEGYASGYQYSCSSCAGENKRSAIGERIYQLCAQAQATLRTRE